MAQLHMSGCPYAGQPLPINAVEYESFRQQDARAVQEKQRTAAINVYVEALNDSTFRAPRTCLMVSAW